MDQSLLRQTLRELSEKQPEIQGVVLVSEQGQPLTTATGFDEDSILIMAGRMLYFSGRVQEELQWPSIDHVFLRATEGYLMLVACTEETFLLVKTTKTPSGMLEQEIKQTINQLSSILNTSSTQCYQSEFVNQHFQRSQNPFSSTSSLDAELVYYCERELAEFIGPISKLVCQRILKQSPNLIISEFIEALARFIPIPQDAQFFQQRLITKIESRSARKSLFKRDSIIR